MRMNSVIQGKAATVECLRMKELTGINHVVKVTCRQKGAWNTLGERSGCPGGRLGFFHHEVTAAFAL